MLIDVKVPQLPESVSEATLAAWHASEGARVDYGQNLADIETDKIVMELPAAQTGILKRILKPQGAAVVSGEVIGVIDTEAVQNETPEPTALARNEAAAMPAAAKLAREHGIDLAAVSGTGRDGRITKADVQNLLATTSSAAQPAASPVAGSVLPLAMLGERPEQRVPMSRLRQRVAERLVESQRSSAILTTFNEVNLAPLTELRERYRERFEKEYGVRLGFLSFFVKAVVHALKKYPILNASVEGGDIIYHGYFDIGVAVSSPRGLVVPVIRDADRLSFADIERQIADFGKRAKEGALTLEELTGGTYTLSNGGVFGSMMSTPIINPPQSAILGMHAVKDRPVAENGQVVIRPMMYLAQSYDHRIIDGREAVLSLVAIKEAIEDPARLLLEL